MNKQNHSLTAETLAKSSLERLVDAANFKRHWTLLLTADKPEYGLKANASLVTAEPYHISPYTCRAIFNITRGVGGVPYGCTIPSKSVIKRVVLIRQRNGGDLVKEYGSNGMLFAGLTGAVATTHELIEELNELYDIGFKTTDVVNQAIAPESQCVRVKFSSGSLNFIGSVMVDLFTPIDG